MVDLRRSRAWLVPAALVAAVLGVGAPAAAQTTPANTTTTTTTAPPAPVVHPIVFPVIGEVTYTDTYGAPRSGGRRHAGQDLMGPKMLELVAAADGRITYVANGATAGHMVELTADDGWVYSYVHLNNDTPGTDDGKATPDQIYGPGIVKGARVTAGQVIGYLGDSGNAEATPPHLHFEMKDPTGRKINPFDSLEAARRLAGPAAGTTPSPIPRLAGADRLSTAVAVSTAGWPQGAADVVLAAGDRYAEALPASVLAAARSGPLLLTTGSTLPDAVRAELDRLGATRVAVVGSVPAAVADAVAATGRTVERLGAPGDPTGTAAAIARAVGGSAGVAVLVNGSRFSDGVSATTVAAGRGWPVLLTSVDRVPQVTVDTWRALGVRRLVVVGGTSAIGANIERFLTTAGRCAGSSAGCEVERLAGADRYATSVAVAQRSIDLGGRSTATVLLGTGTAYPDVLASGPLASRLGGLALLVDGTGSGADAASRSFLAAHAGGVQKVSILGGSGAVTSAADRAVQEALGLR